MLKKKKKRKFLLHELVSSETVGSRTLVERALDEESEMRALYHPQGVRSGLLFAYVSCMQALTLLKHRVSEFFSRPKVKQMQITKKGAGDKALLELRQARGKWFPWSQKQQEKLLDVAPASRLSDVPLLSLTSSPQCLLRPVRSLHVLSPRGSPKRDSGDGVTPCGHGTTLPRFITVWDEVS